jgi:hypothetical protein
LALADAAGGVRSVKIGIIDGVPDLAHPALQDAAIEILEMMVPDGCRAPDPHGTGVCSVIFGNSDSIRGIAPACSGLVLPIFFGSLPRTARDRHRSSIWRGPSHLRWSTTFRSSM